MTRICRAIATSFRLVGPVSALSACLSTTAATAEENPLTGVIEQLDIAPGHAALIINRLEDEAVWSIGGARLDERVSPASTAKIPHTLIALETGAVSGPGEMFAWDGQARFLKSWNEDQDFAAAFQRSTVWIYQIVTRRIGSDVLEAYLTGFGYGNGETGPAENVSDYWLTGPLTISAREQVSFLTGLQRRTLPGLSPETYETALPIMVNDLGEGWTLYGKTGWFASDKAQDIGWFVGWLEQAGGAAPGTYVFAFNMDMTDPDTDVPKRRQAVLDALEAIGAL